MIIEVFLFFAFLLTLLFLRNKYVGEIIFLQNQMTKEMHRLLAEQHREFQQELWKFTGEKLHSALKTEEETLQSPAAAPEVKHETPEVKAETPEVKAETPEVKAETPEVKSGTPEAKPEGREKLHVAPWKAPEEECPPQYVPNRAASSPWEYPQRMPQQKCGPKETETSKGWNWFWYGREEILPGDNLEYIAASNWLIRAGMLILVLGVGFFVNYSIEQGWFLPAYRLLAATFLGGLMYVFGIRLWNTSLNLLGQALLAGSACVMYFSAYGAAEMWGLIPHWAGLAWGCGITAALAVTAVQRNSRLVAVLGTLGAYITPYLFPILRNSEPGLALYLLILATGILFLRRWKSWQIPAWIAFFGTVQLWGNACIFGNTEIRWILVSASFLLLALFHVSAQRRIRNIPDAAVPWDFLLAGGNALFFGGAFLRIARLWKNCTLPQIQGFPSFEGELFMGNALLALVVLLFSAAFLLLKQEKRNRLFRIMNGGLALLFIFILIVKNVEGRWFLPVSMLGFTLFHYIGQKIPSQITAWTVRALAMCTATCGIFYMFYAYSCAPDELFSSSWHSNTSIWNHPYLSPDTCMILIPERIILFFIPVLCLGTMAFHAYRESKNTSLPDSIEAAKALGIIGFLFFMTYITLETNLLTALYFPEIRLFATSFLWTFIALSLLLAGIYRQISILRYMAAALFAVVIIKIFFADISFLKPLARIFAFLILGFLILSGGVIYLKNTRS